MKALAIILLIGTALGITAPYSVHGQVNNEGSKYRFTRKAIIELMEKYDRELDREGDHYFSFPSLFASPDTRIMNDILIENNLDQTLTLQEYEKRRDQFQTSYRFIQNLHIDRIGPLNYLTSTTGSAEIHVTRELRWSLKRNEDFVYNDTIQQVFTINFQQSDTRIDCQISAIRNAYPLGYHILIRGAYKNKKSPTPMQNDSLIVNDNLYTTNEMGYIILKRLQMNESLKIKTLNPDFHQTKVVRVADTKKRDEKYTLVSFRLPKWTAELNAGIMPLAYNNLRSADFTSRNLETYGLNVSIGRIIARRKTWDMSIKLGAYHTWQNTILSSPTLNYRYDAIDPDNAKYQRLIKLEDFEESLNISLRGISTAFNFTYHLNQSNSIQAEIGYQHVLYNEATSSRGAASTIGGFYPELFGVSIFENGIYDFGKHELFQPEIPITLSIPGLFTSKIQMMRKISRISSFSYGLSYRQSIIRSEDGPTITRISSSPNEINSILNTIPKATLGIINIELGYQVKF